MKNTDKPKFVEILTGCASVFRHQLDDAGFAVFWSILAEFELTQVVNAFEQHLRESKFFPTPAEIINLIPGSKAKQHLSGPEAWSVAVKLQDETDTVIVTQQILEAWGVAYKVLCTGDKYGARTAFISAYDRADKSQVPKWTVSPGTHVHLRHDRVKQSVLAGMLLESYLEQYPCQESSVDANQLLQLAVDNTLRIASQNGRVLASLDEAETQIEKAKVNITKIKNMLSGHIETGKTAKKRYRDKEDLRREKIVSAAEEVLRKQT